MMTKTEILLSLWVEARTRFSLQLDHMSASDLSKRLGDSPNSVGFLIRHIGDVKLLFAKNVFSDAFVKVKAKTVMDQRDTGEWTDEQALKAYVATSFETLHAIVA